MVTLNFTESLNLPETGLVLLNYYYYLRVASGILEIVQYDLFTKAIVNVASVDPVLTFTEIAHDTVTDPNYAYFAYSVAGGLRLVKFDVSNIADYTVINGPPTLGGTLHSIVAFDGIIVFHSTQNTVNNDVLTYNVQTEVLDMFEFTSSEILSPRLVSASSYLGVRQILFAGQTNEEVLGVSYYLVNIDTGFSQSIGMHEFQGSSLHRQNETLSLTHLGSAYVFMRVSTDFDGYTVITRFDLSQNNSAPSTKNVVYGHVKQILSDGSYIYILYDHVVNRMDLSSDEMEGFATSPQKIVVMVPVGDTLRFYTEQ